MNEDRRPERFISVMGQCDFCEGMIDNCYQCSGAGSYTSTIDTESGNEVYCKPVRVMVTTAPTCEHCGLAYPSKAHYPCPYEGKKQTWMSRLAEGQRED